MFMLIRSSPNITRLTAVLVNGPWHAQSPLLPYKDVPLYCEKQLICSAHILYMYRYSCAGTWYWYRCTTERAKKVKVSCYPRTRMHARETIHTYMHGKGLTGYQRRRSQLTTRRLSVATFKSHLVLV